MDNKIIQFRPRASQTPLTSTVHQQAPSAPAEISRFMLDHELTELTLTVAQAAPAAPRVRY